MKLTSSLSHTLQGSRNLACQNTRIQICLSLINSQPSACGPTQRQWHSRPFSWSRKALNRKSEATRTRATPVTDDGEDTALSHQVRLLMRRVPHAVAIITACSDTPTQASEKTFRGMTVSSFNTVTLSPTPVVAFNVRRPSETLNALQSSARFCVHLLASTDATARLARDFSRGNENLHLSAEDKGEFEFPALPSRRSDGGGGVDELPILRRKTRGAAAGGGGGANKQPVDFPFVFECEYLPDKAVEIHDHIIVLGRVVCVHLAPESASASRSEAKSGTGSSKDLCLTYADARFWKMGEEI